MTTFEDAFAQMPLIAILRHLDPASTAGVGEVLGDAGFQIVEVPLNDEQTALACIEILADSFGADLVIGAGTVTGVAQVQRVHDAGGRIVVSPDTNADVIAASIELGLTSCPGISTPTEAFAALRAGANLLKLFPASVHGPGGLAALRDVLPSDVPVVPVGGVNLDNAANWRRSGADGLGIGSSLYRPGATVAEVAAQAKQFIAAWASETQ